MCGIAGFIDNTKSREDLVSMANAINRRGPDDEGFYFENTAGLAHKRLSILDLSNAGHQPMCFNKKVIVFNGEIYNFNEIKKELIQKGYHFLSSSDTEVILKAFDYWGVNCVDRFIGMFAFAIYCEQSKKLYLFRDRAGVKPLYYHLTDKSIAFGSELKCFKTYLSAEEKSELDINAVSEFFTLGFISSNLSILKNVKKLPAAHYLVFNNGAIELKRYWDVSFIENKDWLVRKENDILDELEELIISAFKYRMVADVPIGVFLSSGVDSSLVTAVLTKHFGQLNTFTIGFNEKKYDESGDAEKIAHYLKTIHKTSYLDADKTFEIFSNFYDIYDEPHGDGSCIPTTFVSEIAKNSGVKVVLSADAGDELFGGYTRYTDYYRRWKQLNQFGTIGKSIGKNIFSLLSNFGTGNQSQKLKRFNDIIGSENFIDFYQYIIRSSSVNEMTKIIPQYRNPLISFNKKNNIGSQMMEWDFKRYMVDDILVKVDRATMYHSIEGREPFLDHRLIEFASQLPIKFKIKDGEKKYILKKLLSRYIPDELFKLPKRGFSAPILLWMKQHYKSEIEFMLNNNLFDNNYLDKNYTSKLLSDFISGKSVNSVIIWYIYSFQKWYNKWNEINF